VAKYLALAGVVMASINIFGGFAVTERMLAMYKKKEK
jgi:NAD(P) transhydrogenase subunit alpha